MKITLPFPLLLALRFIRSSSQERALSSMLTVCLISIMLGTGGLTLVAAIMKGFEQATHQKLQGIHADITISSHNRSLDFPKLKKVLTHEFADKIAAVSPSSFYHVLVKPQHSDSEGNICILRVVDPATEPLVTSLGKLVKSSAHDPWNQLTASTIFIGAPLAEMLNVSEGSILTLLYPEETSNHKAPVIEQRNVKVVGIFKTGVADFDERVIIGSLALAKELASSKITHISIHLKDPQEEQTVIAALRKRLPLEVYSWKELYPQLLSALTLEKYAMIFILGLVALIASMNIISLLFMYVTHKRFDIALLKAMGMTQASLTLTFIIISSLLTLAATILGIIAAALGTFLLHRFPFIKLPDAYFVSHLPAHLDGSIIISVLLLALAISIIAALLPARSMKAMNVSHVLRGLP